MFDLESLPAGAGGFGHTRLLDILARADAVRMAALAETLLPDLGEVEVVQSRTGMVMLPLRDTVTGTDFHLGEVLVAEAHLRLTGREIDGYGMITGRDLERAMAMAVIDAAAQAGIGAAAIAAFATAEADHATAEDAARLCAVEATRVDMETF